MSRKDLRIHHINKEMDREGEDERLDDKHELKMLPDLLIICYKPILSNLLHIGENIRYVKNIRTNHIYEIGIGIYIIVIREMSARKFLDTFGFLKPKKDKVEEAFALLMKNGLIKPIMNFRGEIRYELVDYELYFLMRSIRLIIDFDANINKTKEDLWPPDYEEIEKRKLFFVDEVSLQKSLLKRELKRDVFRKQIKKIQDPKEFDRMQKKVKAVLEKSDRGVLDLINRTRKDYEKLLKKYAFLSDVIGAFFPSLFQ
jgi:hypothetical protein